MDSAATEFGPHCHASILRASWQGRVLVFAEGKFGSVVESVLAHNFDDTFPVLLKALGRWVKPPGLCSAGKIAKNGTVCADVVHRSGMKEIMHVFFRDTKQMEGCFRRLADDCKLTDAERVELFAAVQRWVVCDYRLDPTMDRRDPDAKRLVH